MASSRPTGVTTATTWSAIVAGYKERERKHQDEAIARLEENIRRFKGTTEKMAKIARSWETRSIG